METNPVIAAEAASDLKGDISKICASLMFFIPLSRLLVAVMLKILSKTSGLKLSELVSAVSEGHLYWIYMLVLSTVPVLFCLIFLALLQKRRINFASLKPGVDGKTFSTFLAIGLLGTPISWYISGITANIFTQFNLPLPQSYVPNDPAGLIVFFLSYVVFAPLFEELIFRTLILERLRRYGDVFAIFTTAAFFSLLHSSVYAFPYTFASGLIFSFIAVKTGSSLCSMILHAINNLISCFSMMIARAENQILSALFIYGIFGIMILFAVLALVFRDKEKGLFEFEFNGQEIADSRKFGIVLSGFFPMAFYTITLVYAFFNLLF